MGAIFRYGRQLGLSRNEANRGPVHAMGIPISEIEKAYQEMKSRVEEKK